MKKLAAVLLMTSMIFIIPIFSQAGHAYFTVYDSTGTINTVAWFDHDDGYNHDCGGVYTNKMTLKRGTVTSSSIYIYNHVIRPSIDSGVVYGGPAHLHNQEGNTVTSFDMFDMVLMNDRDHTIVWNRNFSLGPKNKMMTAQQYLYPGEPSWGGYCQDNDNIHLYHGSSSLETSVETGSRDIAISDLNETYKGKELYILSENDFNLNQNKANQINNNTVSINYRSDNDMIEIMHSTSPVEFVNLEKINHSDLTIYTTENLDGKSIFVIEHDSGGDYVYFVSSLSLDDTTQLYKNSLKKY